jgi:alkylation response protein AidB-like acyl-CoA dehydrogenase
MFRGELMDLLTIQENVKAVANQFARERGQRQRRRELAAADFDQLQAAGLHLTGVLSEHGGLWESVPASTRAICDLLRVLAGGDSSVALVCAMHPAVLSFWLAVPEVDPPYDSAWGEQRAFCSRTALEGEWWGTITSEPGSGGDIFKTRTIAQPDTSGYTISGLKHFGSGSGITSFMITTAVPAGEAEPDLFFMDVRGVPWDGSTGLKLMFPWDGHGMIATQSHGMQFENFPVTRCAWPGNVRKIGEAVNGFIACCFTAVIVGIVETAMDTARQGLRDRHASMRPYEQVEWTRVEQEAWLVQQAYEGMLHAIEARGSAALHDALLGKTAVAELAESALGRLCKIMGGGSYARFSPFGFWFEDVRALGFLRPPWALAYDQLFQGAWPAE